MLKTSPFHPRTSPLVRAQTWRRWAGYQMASAYDPHPDREYAAIRNAAALIDVSALYKYRITGRDAMRLLDRTITRDMTKLKPGQVYYTPWCDGEGKVVDDGTVTRLDESSYRLTSADSSLRWLHLNAAGMSAGIEDLSERVGALSLQGPLSRAILSKVAATDMAALKYFRFVDTTIAGIPVGLSRTGYTGDLGYELWIPAEGASAVWDALFEAGRAYAIRPAGIVALDVTRLEAGLVMLEVDYTSARHAMNPEQNYSPFEIGLGKLVSFEGADYVGRRALQAEVAKGGPDRRLVGLVLDWYDIEKLFDDQGLPPGISPYVDRSPIPVFADGRQVGKATSHGWSPILKQALALAYVPARHERVGTKLQVEWTVEGRRGRVSATVVELPFLDLERKRA